MADPHLPHALRILARDIHCEDGIATQAIREAADEIDRLRLTDAEREAVETAANWLVQLAKDRGEIHSAGYFVDDAATLRGLLKRLK